MVATVNNVLNEEVEDVILDSVYDLLETYQVAQICSVKCGEESPQFLVI